MSKTIQSSMFGEPLEEHTQIETTGRVIRPWKRMLDQFVDEYKLHFAQVGPSVNVVDPAHVSMVQTTLYSDALESYETQEEVIGVPASALGSALQHARYGKRSDDPVSLKASEDTLETTTTRTYGDTSVTHREQVDLTNPDSIRGEPDVAINEFDVYVKLDPKAFTDTVSRLSGDYLWLDASDTLSVSQDRDVERSKIEFDINPEGSALAYYSMDYIDSVCKAIDVSYADHLTLKFSDEYPVCFEFGKDGVFTSSVFVSPRIYEEHQ